MHYVFNSGTLIVVNYINTGQDTISGKDEKQWYAIRVTYNREMKVKQELDSLNISNFLPMKYSILSRGGNLIKVLTPAISNLIFINISKDEMREYRNKTQMPIRYIMDKETNQPIIIPKKQMDNFIAVAGTHDEQIVYLNPTLTQIKKGERVRITGGIFEGTEGEFVRVKGDRRVVVTIQGIVAIATAFIHPSLIEKI